MREPLSIALNCPSCGAAVRVAEGDRIISCSRCGSRHVLTGIKGALRYTVPFSVARDEAKKEVLRYFRMRTTAQDMMRQGQLKSVTPLYVPFWRINERYLGWLMERRRRPRILRRGTVFNLPACSMRGLGFTRVTISERDLREMKLFKPEEAQREAVVYDVTIPSEYVLEHIRRSTKGEVRYIAPSFLKRVKRVSTSVSLVYFPFWLIKYSYRGRFYQVVIDGRRKTIVSARFPANPLVRLAPVVSLSTLTSFVGSSLVRLLIASFRAGVPSDILVGLLVVLWFVLPFGLFLLMSTYGLLRHTREVLIQDSRRTDFLPGAEGRWVGLLSSAYSMIDIDLFERIRRRRGTR